MRKFSSIINDMRKLLQEFVKIVLNEAENDSKYLEKINFRKLHQQTPDADPRELQKRSYQGPIFSARTINFIHQLDANSLPRHNRKEFVKWLASLLEKGEDNYSHQNPAFQPMDVQYVSDWINGANIQISDLPKNFWTAHSLSITWHQSLLGKADFDTDIEETGEELVVYKFPDGFKIVKLKSGECEAEGGSMGHCVGDYAEAVESGETEIYSLRDPQNRPHATVSVLDEMVVDQIKGRQNKVPIPKYAEKIKEWLKTTSYDVSDCDDYFNILSNVEKKQRFIEIKNRKDGGKFALMFLQKRLGESDMRLSRQEFTRIALGAALAVVHLAENPEETERQLEIVRAWSRGLATEKELEQARKVLDDRYYTADLDPSHPNYASAAAVQAGNGMAMATISWVSETNVDPKKILDSIEDEIGTSLENFLFRDKPVNKE